MSSEDSNNIGDESDIDDFSTECPRRYFRNLSLRYFAAEPKRMLNEHVRLKELCLHHGNREARYIEGILQYFVHNDKHTGLRNLRLSAIGNYKIVYFFMVCYCLQEVTLRKVRSTWINSTGEKIFQLPIGAGKESNIH